jgi:hypothetical protein
MANDPPFATLNHVAVRRAAVILGLENPSLALRNGLRVKVAAMTATTHNPSEEPCIAIADEIELEPGAGLS